MITICLFGERDDPSLEGFVQEMRKKSLFQTCAANTAVQFILIEPGTVPFCLSCEKVEEPYLGRMQFVILSFGKEKHIYKKTIGIRENVN